MNTETKKVLALVALIVTTGVGTVEMTRSPAQANPAALADGATGYAGERIEQVFSAVAEMPPVAPVTVPVAAKGDMPSNGCTSPFTPVAAAECIDAAYNVPSGPYVIQETRGESSSILTRVMGYTVAGLKTTLTE